ncbi:MAG: hypothetical protein K2Y71_27430 [Xanthobacteraceae bacterium]|nr:hypothetical protein [Xanthobacteraceae bacterium]
MRNRMTSAVPALSASAWVASVVVVAAATSAAVQTGHAQTATAQAKADECLARPGAAGPKGTHWFYRIDRKSNRRCWYLGPAGQRVRPAATAERAEAAERPAAKKTRRAVPTPAPAPSELRPDEATRAEPPPTTTGARSAAPAESNAVAATNFSAAWPTGASGGPYVPAASTAPADAEAGVAVADPAAEEISQVWPAMSAADRAAAQPTESGPGLMQLVIFLAATVAFVAIAIRMALKLTASQRVRPERREPVRPAEPVIRRREPGRTPATEPSIEAMSEPAIARLREVAKRWDTPARVPRQPRLPAFELEPDYEVKANEPRRRRAVA